MVNEQGMYSKEYETLAKRVEQLGHLVHTNGGRCTIMSSYEDFISTLLHNGYTITICRKGNQFNIEFWKDDGYAGD